MIVFRKVFCYAGWKSLHIPIAIIKLSGLNVFICIYIFCGRRIGPRNVRPIKKLGPSVLIGFPICLSTYVLAYLCAPCSRRQDTSSARSRTLLQTEREWPDLPSWFCNTFTYCTIKFSHRWMTHDVFCMSRLVNTPDSDNQLVRRELCAWTMFRLTCSLHSVLCSLLPEQGKSIEVYRWEPLM